jgi:hypothetical protein
MVKLGQLTRPVMRTGAGFHADQARWQVLKEFQHLTTP